MKAGGSYAFWQKEERLTMKMMNTKAIYTIREKGKEFCFFSEYAGGFSYPFAVADFLNNLKYVLDLSMLPQKGLCAVPLLEQMTGNYLFPAVAEGKELFVAVEKEQVLNLVMKQQVSFGIEIDMEQDTILFHFRDDCEELQEFCDITLPRRGREGEYRGERFYSAADNLRSSDINISAANEEVYKSMILNEVQKQNMGIEQQM